MTEPESYAATVSWLALTIQKKLNDYQVEPRVPTARCYLDNVFEEREP